MGTELFVDSSVLVAVILKEQGAETLALKLANAEAVFVGAPVLLETLMVLTSRWPGDPRNALRTLLRFLDAEIIPFTEEHYEVAAEAFLRFGKGRHAAGLNFGDCISYSFASVAGFPLLYKGVDFAHTDIAAIE